MAPNILSPTTQLQHLLCCYLQYNSFLKMHTPEARSKNKALNQINNKFFVNGVTYIYQTKVINLAENFVVVMAITVGHESR
jgi:hypothetical protein